MPSLDFFFDLLQLAIKERTQLALENIALRQQLAVYKRSVQRPNINEGDRYAVDYNEPRTRQSLGGKAPTLRYIEREGEIVAKPVLGGLHHRYSRAALEVGGRHRGRGRDGGVVRSHFQTRVPAVC